MRNWLRYIMCLAIMTTALQLWSRTWSVSEVRDTVFFYKTWQQILDNSPEGMLIEPDVFVLSDTPYDLAILTPDEDFNRALLKDYIAASQGDSIWVISSEYLKANFGGDVKYLNGFLLMYFNDKVAYFISAYGSLSVTDILFGASAMGYEPKFYYIDFLQKKVLKINHSALSGLLEDYHDLQMRYEGMKDYKKSYVIEDFFYRYIDRVAADPMRPYILDLVPSVNDNND